MAMMLKSREPFATISAPTKYEVLDTRILDVLFGLLIAGGL
ncbi:hypothetical protein PPEP_a1898 [Pseudoalteromonas peptidolytica F12-50-A1]|uniref:Uncharacterized protein n=1 Tax=Pseudoalteromonas peptidolytica F12-50-A1 TaxID=1315280 RepID=A0A8I0MY17_9GAMM|nr:hypothetical protein [Pseudoalteromonas peptidolytica F12-50-A1]